VTTLGGFYVLRTNLPAAQLDSAAVVRSYRSLRQVERDFRSLKTLDLHVRPIHHYTEADGFDLTPIPKIRRVS
jgi:transposase